MSDELEHKLERRFDLPGGGTIKVSIASSEPIDEDGLLILRPGAAVAMAETLMGMARAFKPGDGERDIKAAYDAGFACGRDGPNEANCYYGHFATPELTREWERGRADGEKKREI